MNEGAPKGPVQRIAAGLLGFFQLKDQGNPTVIRDGLQPTLELRDWYLGTATNVPPVVSTLSAPGGSSGFFPFTTNPLVVPQNEWWWVSKYTVFAQATAVGDNVNMAPAALYTVAGQAMVLGPVMPLPIASVNKAPMSYANGFWLAPGYQLGVFVVQQVSAANITYVGNIEFVRLPV